jgi:Protein involved in catabolism of external DNA
MPYKHAGEIGDVWKHLPLCDVLKIEAPKKYYETNSAYAEYQLEVNSQNQYGIYRVLEQVGYEPLENSIYFKILNNIQFKRKNKYYGSPALAMTILSNDNASFHFHDIEKEPLNDIIVFSEKLNIKNKVTTTLGDSISAFMQENYSFDNSDFIFIDPYQPFVSNDTGETFFDVFIKAYRSKAKTMLWYGYDNLNDKNNIIGKLQSISYEFDGASIHTFDVWLKCMKHDNCKINPGVPGCGIAVANLSKSSINKIEEYLYIIGSLYSNVNYNGEKTSLCIGHLSL